MSENFLHSFGDESSELRRQIGCMTRILQMFDRQHLSIGMRHDGCSRKSLSSGHTLTNDRTIGTERSRCSLHIVPDKNSNKCLNENTGTSIESPRIMSVSSSSYSSFSSLDCSKSTKEEPSTIDQSFYTHKSMKESQAGLSNVPIQSEHRSVVKDSIYEESRSPTLRTSLRDETKMNLAKHKNLHKTIQLLKPVSGSQIARIGGKSRIKYLADKLGVRIEPKKSPQSDSDAYGQERNSFEAKDTLLYRISNESAQVSYEERNSLPSLDTKEGIKLSLNLRELPRLSLDSRERALRSSKFDLKPNTNSMDFDGSSINRRADMNLLHQQGVGGNNQLPSVVAKLMGLEAMPKLSQKKIYTVEKKNIGFISTQTTASKGNREDPAAPRLKKTDSIVKPISHLKVPIEPAPWRNPDKIRAHQKIKLGSREVQMKHQPESVCHDMETTLKHVEFEQSIKDLRTLKHILDVMHAEGLLEIKKDDDIPSETSVQVIPSGNLQKIGLFNNQKTPCSHRSLIKKSPRSINRQIVIMKPTKHINRSNISTSTVIPLEGLSDLRGIKMHRKKAPISTKMDKDPTTKGRTKCTTEENDLHTSHSKMSQMACRLPKSPREDHENSVKASTSVSPRLQQKKLEIENRSCPPVSSYELNKQPSIRNSSESVSPRCSLRHKPARAKQNDEKPSDICREATSQKHQVDKICFRTDTCISLASQIDLEVRSPNCSQSSSGRVSKSASSVSNQKKKKSHSAKEDILAMDPKIAISKQPSPISVLDDSLYGDDLPTMRVSSDSLEDDKIEASLSLTTCCDPLLKSSPLFHHPKKLTNINHLIQKLSNLSYGDAKPPTSDRLAADHQYVAEILHASGLLMRDLTLRQINTMATQLHPSGHLINPDLFLVLEQTKSGYLAKPEAINKSSNQFKQDTEKLHRKLVFDVVNELLLRKLELAASPLHVCPKVLVQGMKGRFPSRHQLLKDLCSDIDHLKAESLSEGDDNLMSSEDLLQLMECETDSCKESQAATLEIEMLIFKDLIDEVVNEEDA